MFSPPSVTHPVSATALSLCEAVRDGKLVMCVGAGLSVAEDACLPTGVSLAELLDERLTGRFAGYVSPVKTNDLIAVADAATQVAGGLEVIQREVLKLADFETAIPNYGHEVLALLLAEGGLTVLSWNWDTCIERVDRVARPTVARTADDIANLHAHQLIKIHGCAQMPASLLITSDQLSEVDPWVDQAFEDHLRASKMVFIGIGDVADYARRRIAELVEKFRPPDVLVVSRSIRSEWETSVWANVIADLEEDRKIEAVADEFLDEFARAWAGELIQRLLGRCQGLKEPVEVAVRQIAEQLSTFSAVDLIDWCRCTAYKFKSGESVILAQEILDALVGIAVHATSAQLQVKPVLPEGSLVDETIIDILLVRDSPFAADVRREAQRRAELAAARGRLSGDSMTFMISGVVTGELGDDAMASQSVLNPDADQSDVFDGPQSITPKFLDANNLVRAAA